MVDLLGLDFADWSMLNRGLHGGRVFSRSTSEIADIEASTPLDPHAARHRDFKAIARAGISTDT